MLILNFGSKSGFGDDFGQYDTKSIILRLLFGQMPLSNSVAMATPKVPGDQKLFERVCYMLKLKVTKFQLPTPNGLWAVLKKPAGGQICSPPSKVGLITIKNLEGIDRNFLIFFVKFQASFSYKIINIHLYISYKAFIRSVV